MWKQDLEALLKWWPEDILIKKLEAVYRGIAITDTSENHWFYDHYEGTLTKKGPRKKGAQQLCQFNNAKEAARILYEEEDGIERDEFGNVIEEEDGWLC